MSALLTARLEEKEEEEEGGDGGEGLLEDDAGYLLSLYSFRNKKIINSGVQYILKNQGDTFNRP